MRIFARGRFFLALAFIVVTPLFALGQGMMTENGAGSATIVDDHTAREEAEGKEIWEKLAKKDLTCANISDEQFEALGEYFMGIMLGDRHALMNARLEGMHGKEGEEAIHRVMGKRMSGCDPAALMPFGMGIMPMMGMPADGPYGMMGPVGTGSNSNDWFSNYMMGYYGGWGDSPFGFLGGFAMILWWALIIAGIVALVKWVIWSGKGLGSDRSFEVLKERYAKGEITKHQFEEMKKDLGA